MNNSWTLQNQSWSILTRNENTIEEWQLREEKIQESKRRINFRSIIRKGDYFSLKNNQETALSYYLNAYKTLTNDHTLERKIAGVYFDMKDFSSAYKYYTKVPFINLEDEEKQKILSALMFDESITIKSKEFQKFWLSEDKIAYYGYIENCYTGIHNCIISLESYSGSYEPTKKLKDIIDTYMKISTDFQYRNILIAGAFFESKEYLAGVKIAEEIIKKRPDYKIAYKIAGYCNYELGKYKEANSFLGKYYTYDIKDITIVYTLGLINYYLEDYITSNMYFNTAVLGGYTPKTELERRLVYNYFTLGDTKGMFKIFRYLLREPDVKEDDFIIAVHIALQEKDISKGFLWANQGIEKFGNSDMLYVLRGNINLLNNDLDRAITDFHKSYSMNARNPGATLGFAKWHYAKNNYTSAKEYILSTKEIDPDGIFGREADEFLKKIQTTEIVGSGTLDISGSIQ